MNKIILAVMLSVMFSQTATAIEGRASSETVAMQKRIASAIAQGYAVAQCKVGQCRDTNSGEIVTIEHSDKDGYYLYDPHSAAAPKESGYNQN
jgi:hypothetical protein